MTWDRTGHRTRDSTGQNRTVVRTRIRQGQRTGDTGQDRTNKKHNNSSKHTKKSTHTHIQQITKIKNNNTTSKQPTNTNTLKNKNSIQNTHTKHQQKQNTTTQT